MFDKLAKEHAVKEDDVELWMTRMSTAEATSDEAAAELEKANLKYKSEIDGVNTTVANMEAQLQQALYYLDNTTLKAPEDGRIINLGQYLPSDEIPKFQQPPPTVPQGQYAVKIAATLARAKRLDARGNRVGCARALAAAKDMYNLQ